MESTSGQLAALIGTVVAPLVYERLGGLIMTVSGVISLVGLAAVAPRLHQEWGRLVGERMVLSVAQAEEAAAAAELGSYREDEAGGVKAGGVEDAG